MGKNYIIQNTLVHSYCSFQYFLNYESWESDSNKRLLRRNKLELSAFTPVTSPNFAAALEHTKMCALNCTCHCDTLRTPWIRPRLLCIIKCSLFIIHTRFFVLILNNGLIMENSDLPCFSTMTPQHASIKLVYL